MWKRKRVFQKWINNCVIDLKASLLRGSCLITWIGYIKRTLKYECMPLFDIYIFALYWSVPRPFFLSLFDSMMTREMARPSFKIMKMNVIDDDDLIVVTTLVNDYVTNSASKGSTYDAMSTYFPAFLIWTKKHTTKTKFQTSVYSTSLPPYLPL